MHIQRRKASILGSRRNGSYQTFKMNSLIQKTTTKVSQKNNTKKRILYQRF